MDRQPTASKPKFLQRIEKQTKDEYQENIDKKSQILTLTKNPLITSGAIAIIVASLALITNIPKSGILIRPFGNTIESDLRSSAFESRLAEELSRLTQQIPRSNYRSLNTELDKGKNIKVAIGDSSFDAEEIIVGIGRKIGQVDVISGELYKQGEMLGATIQFNGTPIVGVGLKNDIPSLIKDVSRQVLACSNPLIFAEITIAIHGKLDTSDPARKSTLSDAIETLQRCRATAHAESKPEYATALSIIYQERGDLDLAQEAIAQAEALGFTDAGLYAEYALRAYFSGNFELALRASKNIEKLGSSSRYYTNNAILAKISQSKAILGELVGDHITSSSMAREYIKFETNQYDQKDVIWWLGIANLVRAGLFNEASDLIDAEDPNNISADNYGTKKLIEGWPLYGELIAISKRELSEALDYAALSDRIHACAEPDKVQQRKALHYSILRILSSLVGKKPDDEGRLSKFGVRIDLNDYYNIDSKCYLCLRANGYENLSKGPEKIREAEEYFSRAIRIAPSIPFAYVERAYVRIHIGDKSGARKDIEKTLEITKKWRPNLETDFSRLTSLSASLEAKDLFFYVFSHPRNNETVTAPKLLTPDQISSILDELSCLK